jgi:hypothetical protein
MLLQQGQAPPMPAAQAFINNEEEPDDLPFNQKQNINKF